MKGFLIKKGLIILGLLLIITLFLPELIPSGVGIAQASNVNKTNDKYRLYVNSVSLVKGKTFTLRIQNLGQEAKVSYKSDNTDIASVSDNGIITANMVGVATITVTIRDGFDTATLSCEVTVGPPAFSVRMTRSRIIMGLNSSDQLRVIMKPSNTAELARFSSHDSTIADVTSGGRIIANKLGMTFLFAQIDATYFDGSPKFAVCSVIITNSEDVQLLEAYLTDHPELSLLSEAELTSALMDFFNKPATVTPTAAPLLAKSSKTLVEELDEYLHVRFNFEEIKNSISKKASALPVTN